MKKRIALALIAVMTASLAACGNSASAAAAQNTGADLSDKPACCQTDSGTAAQIANPWTDFDTLADAAAQAGFRFTVPDTAAGCPQSAYRLLAEESLLEVQYESGEDSVILRKAPGSGDISGDSTVYSETTSAEIGGHTVTMQGDNGRILLATWEADGSTYAIGCRGSGLSAEDAAALIEEIA